MDLIGFVYLVVVYAIIMLFQVEVFRIYSSYF